ncbi:MAG: hypothetical protein KDD69_06645 [Bdellovibrionales bacterium]|nr:hypothetical protein [Bdellovibrionales bacterium]
MTSCVGRNSERHRRKAQRGRRNERKEREGAAATRHWLGEGSAGQESLLLELEPIAYVLDQAVASISTAVAHRLSLRHEKPFAVLVPPAGSVGWQLGYLIKRFNVYLCADPTDDHSQEAADRFGAKLIRGEFDAELEHEIGFFLFGGAEWEDRNTFAFAVRQAQACTADDGIVSALLLGERTIGASGACETRVLWSDGSSSAMAELGGLSGFTLGVPISTHTVELTMANALDSGRMSAFLKRNRAYFGRETREMLANRIRDEDFCQHFQDVSVRHAQDTPTRLAILVSWSH